MDEKSIKIILADDHLMFRAGLKTLIERSDRFLVVDEASNGEELLAKLKGGRCDLVVMDLSMPKMGGLEALSKIAAKYPRIRVLVLTMQKDTHYFHRTMSTGACGYVLKDDAFEQLVEAIDIILTGKEFVSPSIRSLLDEQSGETVKEEKVLPPVDLLTKRERQVLKLIASGDANKNIAKQLGISIRTVEVHRSNLIRKLGIKTTAGLVKYSMAEAFKE
ncbi:MAG: response regulator transcription factor [Candidatus Omnitrophota bacterium]